MGREPTDSPTLFQTYGTVVAGFFSDDQDPASPLTCIPPPPSNRRAPPSDPKVSNRYKGAHSPAVAQILGGPIDIATLLNTTHKSELKKLQEVIDSFRRILRRETIAQERPPSGEKGKDPTEPILSRYLEEFHQALQTSDESLLETNPFYELTKQIYRFSLEGVNLGFQRIRTREKPPAHIGVSRSLREIWRQGLGMESFFDKLLETLGKWIASGRSPLSILLFFGSTITTASGVNDLLQQGEAIAWIGALFSGQEGELNRYLFSLGCGLALSSAILDYKTRIFQSIVESGGVLSGLHQVFQRYPRWMIIASFLTLISIKTNYDGIVSIVSKKEDLEQQSQRIKSRVRAALGNPFFINSQDPNSLFDLKGSFQKSTADAIALFNTLPEDEVRGVASSGDPRKGPRYWAKHFIVHGGYVPNINDVALVYDDHPFTHRIDQELQGSGIDFFPSFRQKVELLRVEYETNLDQTDAHVRKQLAELNQLMSIQTYSLREIRRMLALEHYQINDIVQTIVVALEANKEAYKSAAYRMEQMIGNYVAILQTIDKAGTSGLSAYTIKAHIEVPKIEAIDQLREGKIPIAKHKNFEELRAALMKQYGISLGSLILAAILVFSIGMDLGDPIVYSRMTARRGKKDRLIFPRQMKIFQQWENAFLEEARKFFTQSDVRTVHPNLVVRGDTVIRNSYYLLMERRNPELKDLQDQTSYERFDHWFRGLFRFSRTVDMAGLNLWVRTLDTILKQPGRHFPTWGMLIHPGFLLPKRYADLTFQAWQEELVAQHQARHQQFSLELQKLSAGDEADDEIFSNDLTTMQKRLTRLIRGSQHTLRAGFMTTCRRLAHSLLVAAPLPPLAPFSHSRRSWLIHAGLHDPNARRVIESINGLATELKHVLFETLPSLQERLLTPVLEELERHADQATNHLLLDKGHLQRRFDQLEKEALELWGVSYFVADDPYGDVGLSTLDASPAFSNLAEVVARRDKGISHFFTAIDQLEEDLEHSLLLIHAREEITQLQKEIRARCVEINQSLMTFKLQAMTANRNRQPPQGNTSPPAERLVAQSYEQSAQQVDNILLFLKESLQSNQVYSEQNLLALRGLKEETLALQNQLLNQETKRILGRSDTQPHTRPLLTAPASTQKEEKKEETTETETETETKRAAQTDSEPTVRSDRQQATPPEEVAPSLPDPSLATPSLRHEERTTLKIQVVYESSRGQLFQGETQHLGQSSLDFTVTTDPSTLPIGNEGRLHLEIGGSSYPFDAKVIRVSDHRIVALILSNQEIFAALSSPLPQTDAV